MERDERPVQWEEPDEAGLANDLPVWFVGRERVRGFGRCGVTPTGRSSGDGAVAGVIWRWQPLGLEFLEDREGGLDGELSGVWVEGLEDPEPWERECRDFVERADTSEELLRECLRTPRSVEALLALNLRSEFDPRLDMTLGSDAKGSEDGWTTDDADMSDGEIGNAEGSF
jgi:hypothetical protein